MERYDKKGVKALACAVILQAVKDYKHRPDDRKSIEKFLTSDNIFVSLVLPDYSKDDLIKGVRRYAEND